MHIRYKLRILTLICTLCISHNVLGQLVGANVYFKGRFVEMGFAPNGSLGGNSAPPGYHPYGGVSSGVLGLRYDWGHDGWSVGLPPAYGEYATILMPFEGWSIQLDSTRYDAFYTTGAASGNSFSPGLSGGFVSYSASGSLLSNVWRGTCRGLDIMQTWKLDTNASWAVDSIVFTNNSGATINNVYYLRSVDNDGAYPFSNKQQTNNTIIYQNDGQGRVLVNSRGEGHPNAYLALAAKDCRAKAVVYTNWSPYPDTTVLLSQMYNENLPSVKFGSSIYTEGSSLDGDWAIGMLFRLGQIPAGGDVSFSFAYLLNGDSGIDSALTTSFTPVCVLPSISGLTGMCIGELASLSNSLAGGVWSSGNTDIATISATGVVTGVSKGIAIITYDMGSACCFVTHTVTIGIVTGMWPSQICVGDSVRIVASSGGTWTSSNSLVATVDPLTGIATGVSPGTTTISYTMPGGCLGIKKITVINQAPPAIMGSTLVCASADIVLSCSVGNGTWNTSASTIATVNDISGHVRGVAAGTAVITYTNACGIATHTVVVLPLPGPVTGTTKVCVGQTFLLSGGAAAGTWSSENSAVAVVDTSGNVTLTGIGFSGIYYNNSCGRRSYMLRVDGSPPTSIVGPARICVGDVITFTNGASGGTWFSDALLIATVGAVTGIAEGTSPGMVGITYSNMCGSATKTVTVDGPGVIIGPTSLCVGSMISLSNVTPGGVWNSANTNILSISSDSGVLTAVSIGGTVISYATNECIQTKTISVAIVPDSIAGMESVCLGDHIVLSNSIAGGVWFSSNNSLATVAAGVVTGAYVGSVIITYSTVPIVDGSCMVTKTVTVLPLPDIVALSDPGIICRGSTVSLSSAVAGGAWTSSDSSVATPVNGVNPYVQAAGEGTAFLFYSIKGGNGCTSVSSAFVSVIPSPFDVDAMVIPTTCYGKKNGKIVILSAGDKPVYNYLWSTGATLNTIDGLNAGIYELNIYEPSTRCFTDTVFVVLQPDSIVVRHTVTDDLCDSGIGKIELLVTGGTGGYNYMWSINATTRDVQQLHAGVYTVTITDGNNCIQPHFVTVMASTCGPILAHDVITPNNDGYNDMWVIEGIQGYPGCLVQVFDKWGDKIFEQQGYRNTWDGKGRNGLLPDGTYYYVIKLNDTGTAGNSVFTGSLMIKR